MNKKALTAATIIFFFMFSLITEMQAIAIARANFVGPIPPDLPKVYIRSNGTIDPPSTAIRQSGNTYFLIDDIVDCTIEVQKDNIILDGKGKSLRASPVEPPLMIPVGWHPLIHLSNNKNVTIRDFIFKNCFTGIYIQDSQNNTISENRMIGNGYGIQVLGSLNINITKNNVVNGSTGIIFYHSSNNTIRENNISSNIEGINFYSASTFNNCVKNNNLTANTGHAIFFDGGVVNHTIIGNNIAYNTIGIGNDLPYRNCTIYSNNFTCNNENVQIRGVEATWDTGKEGNYWSDYNGTDANDDGMGDTPYIIDANNKDNYPFISPLNFIDSSPNPTPTPIPTSSPSLAPSPSPTH
jgi:parallel beta-helix repeat protein